VFGAFQADAFQNDAFQMASGAVVQPTFESVGGGGFRRMPVEDTRWIDDDDFILII